MPAKYINLYTDFGFKQFFGEETNKEEVFVKGFEVAEIANFTQTELLKYEESLKAYRDLNAVVDTSYEKGKEEEKLNVAKNALAEGLSIELIAKLTGLTDQEIEALRT